MLADIVQFPAQSWMGAEPFNHFTIIRKEYFRQKLTLMDLVDVFLL